MLKWDIQWVIFDKLEVTVDTSILIFATILLCIYIRYIHYLKCLYGITDKINNKAINRLPTVMTSILIIAAFIISINCRWI